VAFEAELPTVLGNGVGAAVAAVGHGVDPALAGLRVVTGGAGGYAERAAVDAAAAAVPLPDGLALDDAVALLVDGRTALMLARTPGCPPTSGC
jgi:NADPH2:quinone reductase